MPASVPTAAEFDALAARVAKLEASAPGPAPGPTPGQPSPTGTYITQAGEPAIVDDAHNAWSLVATNVATKGQQIAVQRTGTAPPAMIDSVTAFVSRLGIDLVGGHRQIVQQNQSGAFYTSTAPFSPWQQITGPDGYVPPAPTPGSIFKVANGQFYKPDGSLFTPTGTNVWWMSISHNPAGGGWGQGDQVISDWNTGAPLLQCFPKLNMVRLLCFLADWPTDAQLKPWIDFFTSKRIVLLIDPHDYSGGSNWVYSYADGTLQSAIDFIKRVATTNKNNPYVWFQTENEPGTPNSDEISGLYHAVRDVGNENPVLIGWVTWGYTDRVDPAIIAPMYNVGVDVHYYSMGANNSPNIQDHTNMIDNIARSIQAKFRSHDGLIPITIDEFGDACCGAIESNGQVAMRAVCTNKTIKGWNCFNFTTKGNHDWGIDILNEGVTPVLGGLVAAPYMVGP